MAEINIRKDQRWHNPDNGLEVIVMNVGRVAIGARSLNHVGSQYAMSFDRLEFQRSFVRGKLPPNHATRFLQYQPGTVWDRITGEARQIRVRYTILRRYDDVLVYYTHDPRYTFEISARGFHDFQPIFVGSNAMLMNQQSVVVPTPVSIPSTSVSVTEEQGPVEPMQLVVGATYLAKSDGMPVQADIVRDTNIVFHSDKRFFTYTHEKFRNLFDRAPELTPVNKPTKASFMANARTEDLSEGLDALKEKALQAPDTGVFQGVDVTSLKLAKDVEVLTEENTKLKQEISELKKLLENSYNFLARRPAGYKDHMAILKDMFTPNQVVQQ